MMAIDKTNMTVTMTLTDFEYYRKAEEDRKHFIEMLESANVDGEAVMTEELKTIIKELAGNDCNKIEDTVGMDKDYSNLFNKGNDCDSCKNQYMYGRDGGSLGCKCIDIGTECNYINDDEN